MSHYGDELCGSGYIAVCVTVAKRSLDPRNILIFIIAVISGQVKEIRMAKQRLLEQRKNTGIFTGLSLHFFKGARGGGRRAKRNENLETNELFKGHF